MCFILEPYPKNPYAYLPLQFSERLSSSLIHDVAVVPTIPSSPRHPKPQSLMSTSLQNPFSVKGRDAMFWFRSSLYMDWYSTQMLNSAIAKLQIAYYQCIYMYITNTKNRTQYGTQCKRGLRDTPHLIRETRPESFSAFRIDYLVTHAYLPAGVFTDSLSSSLSSPATRRDSSPSTRRVSSPSTPTHWSKTDVHWPIWCGVPPTECGTRWRCVCRCVCVGGWRGVCG